jgi:eukaryotic-like serine/threonine-protein kinase
MAQQQQRYRVLDRIASGGMAEVYRAESAGLEGFKKTVAIKRVLPHLSSKREFIGMFLDEARLSAHLNHSNCAQVFDIGVGDDTYFIVMEYVDGADLKAVLEYLSEKGRVLPVAAAVYICCKIAEALAYAHEARDGQGHLLGIVHRDMSPPNVLITRHGEVKIVDFGLAKANSQLERSEPGIIKGKFSYLSPEAALGESVDLRTDLFAVGIILWEMLAGRRLFLGETDLQTVRQVQTANVPDVKRFNPGVTAELDGVLKRALARDPRHRYQSARDLGLDLTRLLFTFGKPISAFELGDIIIEVCQDRDNRKARNKQSIIGTLIEDAMMEFTSLQPEGSKNQFRTLHSTTSSLASQPLDTLGAVKDWAADLGMGQAPAAAATSTYAAGNLAALEDDAPGVPLTHDRIGSAARAAQVPGNARTAKPTSMPPASVAQSSTPLKSLPPSAPHAALPPQPTSPLSGTLPPQPRTPSSGVVFIVVALVVAAGAAGAYLSGMMN